MNRAAVALIVLVAAAVGITCAREDVEPDPPTQVLVPCDEGAPAGDPSACPPVDAGVDGALDAAPPDAP